MADKSIKEPVEITALIGGSKVILEHHRFEETARAIFETCKKLIKAEAGYVALLSDDGVRNEVLFLDSGGLECTVDPSLPMPIRGLRSKAYQTGKAVYNNSFSNSDWVRFMPSGHMTLENVLFAPLTMNGKAVGLIGLANKKGGFDNEDARLASAFGDFLAISLTLSRTLEALEESERKYRQLIENLNEGIWVIDGEGKTVFVNPRMAEMLGFTEKEMIGRRLFDFMDESRVPEANVYLDRRMKGIREQHDFEFLKRNGEKLYATLETSPITDAKGNYVGTLAGVMDVTEKRRMELELKEYTQHLAELVDEKTWQLIDAEQMVAAGKLASMVGHDLRGPLIAIVQAVSMIKLDATKANKMLEMIERNADKGIKMLEELRNQTRDAPINLDYVKLEDIIQQGMEEVMIPNSIKVSTRFESDLVSYLDRLKMQRVLQNMIKNAVEAMPNGGQLTVSTRKLDSKIEIKITDTGVGISDDGIKKIYKPFYTTKPNGLGLGLPFCKRVVEAHGGSIKVESRVDKGTTFVINMPIENRKME